MVLFIPVRCLITVVQILLTDISAARLSYQDEQGWRFKPIYYNREELQLNYTRYKSHNTSLNISFHALNRDFFLNLHAIQPSSIEYTAFGTVSLHAPSRMEFCRNKIRAVNEIHYMIRDHMKVLNDVFEGTKFTVNHGKADEFTINGFQFEVENPHTGICSPVNVAFVNLYVSEKVPYQPNTMTKLVFAHEVAHTFGAPHDNNKTACGEYSVLKESDAGYFLMHEVAVTGDLRNNFKFSNCSFDKIGTVLARETSTSCFKVQAKDLAVVEIPNCNRSVCDLIGWHECELANGATKLTIKEKEELCYVGCQKTKSSQCISTNGASARAQFPELDHLLTTIAERDGWEDTSIRVPVGTPCNRMTGYCDVFQRCRGVDPDTPLAKLKRCFKQGGDCISVFIDFLSSKVGLFTLAIVAVVILTFTLVKCLSIHTKSSNPHLELKHPHRSVRESAINRQSRTLSRENSRNVNDEVVHELEQLSPK
ncbi:ADA10-like protein [Mya arenaria]|uniref:ADA10-like protein n=1 Tax=Mya arenaria TaxID=6604 RepID=A0ABY7EJ37_MYAAR|nr:ADA10-like protein [Mya arenaria]